MQGQLDQLQLRLLEPIELPVNPCEETIHALSLRAKPLIRLYKTGQCTLEEETEAHALLDTLNQKRLFEFIQAVNHEMITLNQLILQYNAGDNLELKTGILREISAQYAAMDARFPESVISRSPAYRTQFYDGLASDIRRHTEQLAHLDPHAPPLVYPDDISELLHKMPQDKLNRFLSLLCDRTNYEDELEQLYAPTDPEYPQFMGFLETHSIHFLGGRNINNFEIKRLKSSEPPYVLKIENRINQPKDIVKELYEKVDNFVQPAWSLRAYCSKADRKGVETTIVRSIMTGPYFPEGNVYHYAMQFTIPTDKIAQALNIYTQMAEVLAKIDRAGGVFPDMKNTNWLIQNGKLFIGDDKSIRRRTAEGHIDVFSEQSQWYGDILRSPEYMPPEVFETESIRADALYAFSWAKNLYEFLVASPIPEKRDFTYQKIMEGEKFNFNYPVFRTQPEGPMLQQLISDMVQKDPDKRLSLQEGVACLAHIQLIHSVRTHIIASVKPPLPFELLDQYLDKILQLTPTQLEPYKSISEAALTLDIQPYIDEYSTRYNKIFSETITEIEEILAHHPHDKLRQALLAAKIGRHTLTVTGYVQFESDLNEILWEAEQFAAQEDMKDLDLGSDDEYDDYDDDDNEHTPR